MTRIRTTTEEGAERRTPDPAQGPRHALPERGARDNRPLVEGWPQRCYDVVFETHTPAGKAFDVVVLVLILASVLVVCLETVEPVVEVVGRPLLYGIEWFFTAIFTIEYLLRLSCVRSRMAYVGSFFGVVDLLSILPTYLGLVFSGAHVETLLVIRMLRLLRVFRILKMGRYVAESSLLLTALRASRPKIIVFLTFVLILVVIVGAAMHLIEGSIEGSGFTSIPRSMYWGIVTLTTVGYGDISPQTVVGQFLAAGVMIMGYGIIAVPTGIVGSELVHAARAEMRSRARTCPACGYTDHDLDAVYCKRCGGELAS